MSHLSGTWIFEHVASTVVFILTLGFVSFILRSKRPPGSTLAWLLFVFAIPYLGIPLYVFLGSRKFKSQSGNKELLYPPPSLNHDLKLNEIDNSLERILAAQGAPPPRDNTQLELITSGEEAYKRTLRVIESARNHIHLTTFIFANDSVGKSILNILHDKVDQGVDVKILLDSLGSTMVWPPSFRKFKKAGGKVAKFMPLLHLPFHGRSNLRNHRKMLLVDSTQALVGGMNIAQEYLGPRPYAKRWLDLCLEIRGNSIFDLETIFACDWKFATGEQLKMSPPSPRENFIHCNHLENRIQVVPSGPDVKGDSLYDSLLTLIYNARHRIWIATPYFVPDESLAKALELASKRGVDVKITIPSKSNHLLADLGRGSYLRQLHNAGASIAFLPTMMHAKAVLVDNNDGLIGSANFDMRSLFLNFEIGLFLSSPLSIQSLESWFLERFQSSQSTLPEAGFWRDLTEGIGRVVGPLI